VGHKSGACLYLIRAIQQVPVAENSITGSDSTLGEMDHQDKAKFGEWMMVKPEARKPPQRRDLGGSRRGGRDVAQKARGKIDNGVLGDSGS